MKKRTRTILLIGAALVVLYLMRDKIQGMVQGKKASGGGGGGGLFSGGGGGATNGGGGMGGNSVSVGPYTIPGATVSETQYVDYKPPSGSSEPMLPTNCISDAFTVNGLDYCIALDSRGQEVTQRIS